MFRCFFTSCFLLLFQCLSAQQKINDSLLAPGATAFAKNIYKINRGNDASIYNGIIHSPYPASIGGTPYFLSGEWQRGTVVFENVLYEDIQMKYDLVKDQLIIVSNEAGSIPLSLFSQRVKEFSFSGFKFIYLDKNKWGEPLRQGFYRVLIQGNVSAFCKSTKTNYEAITSNVLNSQFIESKKYFIENNDHFYSISKKKELLSVLKQHKKEIQAKLKENKLNFKKDKEKTIITAVEIFNKL